MKSVKRNTYRQYDFQCPEVCFYSKVSERCGKRNFEEIIIFENAKKTKIHTYAEPEPKPFHLTAGCFIHFDTGEVIEQGRKYKQQKKFLTPAAIEEVAG